MPQTTIARHRTSACPQPGLQARGPRGSRRVPAPAEAKPPVRTPCRNQRTNSPAPLDRPLLTLVSKSVSRCASDHGHQGTVYRPPQVRSIGRVNGPMVSRAYVTPHPAALLPGLSAVLPTMSPKIIPCISRAISAQDEADGLPAVRFQAWQIQRKRTIQRQFLPRYRPGAVRRSYRTLLPHKFKCSNSRLGGYAESTSGRRS